MAKPRDTRKLVYHYTSRNTAFEKIVSSRQLRFNPFIDMKDPRESTMWTFVLMSSKPIPDATCMSLFKPVSDNDVTDAVKYGCKLLCFSQDNARRTSNYPNSLSGRGFFLSRMWSQYGQGHSGVCFAFDRDELDRTITEELGEERRIYRGSVEYTENELEIHQALGFDADTILDHGLDAAVERHLDLFYEKLFLQKDADWRDENEYRWIIKTQDMKPEYVSITSSIRGIFLGIDFPTVYESLAVKCAKELKTPLYRVKWHNGKSKLSDDLTYHSDTWS